MLNYGEEEKKIISVERQIVKPGADDQGVLRVSVRIGHKASLAEV
jgi:hypothetical protein